MHGQDMDYGKNVIESFVKIVLHQQCFGKG
jgi:hypothetical protein